MSKSLKSKFTVSKVIKTLRLACENFEPHKYELYQVKYNKQGINKLFAHKKDAISYIDKVTTRKMDSVTLNKLLFELKLADRSLA